MPHRQSLLSLPHLSEILFPSRKKSAPKITLNHDVLAIILEIVYSHNADPYIFLANDGQLYLSSPKSIYNVCLTSRFLYHLSQKYLYRKLSFTFSRHRNSRNWVLLERLMSDSTARSSVHQLYINWIAGTNPRFENLEGKRLADQLTDIVPLLPALKKLM